MTDVHVPRFDPSMEIAKIVAWKKKVGEKVEKDEIIALLEGEKTVFELKAPDSGVLAEIIYPEGSTVKVGEKIAIISKEAPAKPVPVAEKKVEKRIVRATPAARRLAKEYGIDLSEIRPAKGDVITREDVLRSIKEKEEKVEELYEVIEPSMTRKTIAERLTYSQRNIPQACLAIEVNVDRLLELRQELKKKLGRRISLTAMLIKLLAEALKKHPILNAHFEDDKIKMFKSINISVAIQTKEGLIAPAIIEADKRSVDELTNAIEDLKRRAERKELTVEELTSGTFTISNLGPKGIIFFIPMINPPQVAILGVGSIRRIPIVVENGLKFTSNMILTLTFDHRAVDGYQASEFLKTLKKLIENPGDILN